MKKLESSSVLIPNLSTAYIYPKTTEITDEIARATESEKTYSGITLADLIEEKAEDTSKDSQYIDLHYDGNSNNDRIGTSSTRTRSVQKIDKLQITKWNCSKS